MKEFCSILTEISLKFQCTGQNVGHPIQTSICRRQISTHHFDGQVQDRRNSIADAMELRLSCTNPSISVSRRVQAYFTNAVIPRPWCFLRGDQENCHMTTWVRIQHDGLVPMGLFNKRDITPVLSKPSIICMGIPTIFRKRWIYDCFSYSGSSHTCQISQCWIGSQKS